MADPAPHEHPHDPHKIKLIFIVNGEDVTIHASVEERLAVARDKALTDTHNTARPFDEWEVRAETGEFLDPEATIEALHLSSGTRLFLTLRVGAGGSHACRPSRQ